MHIARPAEHVHDHHGHAELGGRLNHALFAQAKDVVDDLRSGLYGRARFRGAEQQVVAVPAAALVRRGQLTLVFVDENGTARLRYVHVGTPVGDRIPVLSGLAQDERVVLNPPASLADGARIAARPGHGSGGRAAPGDAR